MPTGVIIKHFKYLSMGTLSNLILILSSVLLNCAAQLFMRKGMLIVGEVSVSFRSLGSAIGPMITNIYLWLSMACYAVSIVLWMVVLSRVEVSFAYPFLSVGYVVAAAAGYYLFGESLSATRIAGILVICLGVYLISRS